MNTQEILSILEIILSIAIAVVILMQQGGSGLGSVFGGIDSDGYRSKRGIESFLLRLTVVLVILFVFNAVAIAILSSK